MTTKTKGIKGAKGIKPGGLYRVRHGSTLVTVRIDRPLEEGGWDGTNTTTGKPVRIKDPRRIRGEAPAPAARGAKETASAPEAAPAPAQAACGNVGQQDAEPKPPSALDAAAAVLRGAGVPMRAKELIAEMESRGLWKSKSGKTPEATLYAAIIREIAAKGAASRFHKVERGQFAHSDISA